MKTKNEKATVLKYVEAINSGNIDNIVGLMSEDHIFIDSGDCKYQGKELMKQGWIGYFNMFPDYSIEITDITENNAVFGLFGYASGTYKGLKGNYFRMPASWKAVVEHGKIKHWQVYCESKLVEEIVSKNN